jgi:hypothetical protein
MTEEGARRLMRADGKTYTSSRPYRDPVLSVVDQVVGVLDEAYKAAEKLVAEDRTDEALRGFRDIARAQNLRLGQLLAEKAL